ncbi:hypothetical protein [uncultured Tolumonas sp.]|uniref:hypothetical protein n=1 Tax=uncultured Tolumonas sp. TaxID=263765 RepID=UPI002A0A5C16|nr:hypothetical protein [uncultured Tolumonas sp.]
MANLQESASWTDGIYQLETTDPVMGGPNGTSNTQAKQLANRTRWLKEQAEDQGNRIASMEDGIDEQAQNSLLSLAMQAMVNTGLLSKSVDNLRKRVLAQGVSTLKNKWVVQGFALSKASEIRALHLSQTGTVGSGTSIAWTDGKRVQLTDDDYHVTVPTNASTTDILVLYAYLVKSDGVYRVLLSAAVPDDGLLLYEVRVAANDSAVDCRNVTLVDRRTIQGISGYFITTPQTLYIAFPYPLQSSSDYDVVFTVESATDKAAVGNIETTSKTANGCSLQITGSADNVKIRWSLLNINYA